MKAETFIKSQSECNKWLKQLTEIELKHLEEMHDEYARIQIEKDRERVKAELLNSGLAGFNWVIDNTFDNTPINLD